ncbi:UNVERIFIED_CONTAM: hypothetical protein HDU68_003152 [Siphonaria sp. JEL0065]|nr:hypothetical protein HDU68_003152 [Siphonaria sp. JEL0065]
MQFSDKDRQVNVNSRDNSPAPTTAAVPTSPVYTKKEQFGVVGLIVVWNYPFYLAIYKMAPAVATGNTVEISIYLETLSIDCGSQVPTWH